ncbi:MAG: hypothetical protein PWQ97_488 [Tepidanaerobacteraceae bacterium]|nr:hypothetical protein [Tepidanaerobacteraceae bacterium]
MNWVDILLLIIFLSSAIEGFSKGLILSAFKMAGVIMALYAGVFYRNAASEFLKTHIDIEPALMAMLNIPQASDAGVKAVGAVSLASFADMAMNALAFFIIFIGVQMLFLIPAFFLNSLVRLTHLTFINRLLGAAFGLARSAVGIALVYSLLSPFLMAWPSSWIWRGINSSYILMRLKFLDFITPVVVKLI